VNQIIKNIDFKFRSMKSLWLKIVFFLIAVALYFLKGLHVVEEGNIGIYFQGNYLLDIWTKPGLHYMHHSKRVGFI
jgi:regulator of protease activity HflC (stomatin/prohibitin superfamily)